MKILVIDEDGKRHKLSPRMQSGWGKRQVADIVVIKDGKAELVEQEE